MNHKKKKGFSFPSAFTVLFIVLIIAAVLTYLVPAGYYERLEYVKESDEFLITSLEKEDQLLPANQEVLDDLGVTIPLDNFQDGSIAKPVAIPGSYHEIEQQPQGLIAVLKAPIIGIADSIGIIVFILLIGGIIGILNETGAFDAGIAALSKKTKGREFLLVVIISTIIAIGGTTFGLAEETIAFYPILMPIFIASGYDAMVAIAAIYMGSSIGTMFSTVNPFSVVIASNAAGINFNTGMGFRLISLIIAQIITLIYIYRYAQKVKKDPSKSLIADDMPRIKEKFLHEEANQVVPFDWRRISMLVIFALSFVVMIWGVSSQGWYFDEMSALFLAVGIIMIFLSGLGEKKAVNTFLNGAADLVSVALIVGVARGINLIMDDGLISDTLLFGASNIIENINSVLFSSVQMLLFSILGIFIPSSSGLATLSMPIVAPLADTINIGRDVVVSAYNYGQGWMAFITPTGLILATLEMVDVTYDKWLKFILPLMGIIGVQALVMLGIQTVF
ncbi:MAG: YfcC family protein [Tissierellia bacterium]|nr:YfcC family protein [Tissierellia bacterium]